MFPLGEEHKLELCHHKVVKGDEGARGRGDMSLAEIVRPYVFTAVTMKNGVFWDVTPFGSCKNRRFGGTYRLLYQGDKNR
jgi:hypothetical protein